MVVLIENRGKQSLQKRNYTSIDRFNDDFGVRNLIRLVENYVKSGKYNLSEFHKLNNI